MERAHREWRVAGGLVERDGGVLLVRNLRRGGFEDWSTPGGVIDDDDASVLSGLTREVAEETGLVVSEWSPPLYVVNAFAPDMGWRMHCVVHLALAFAGNLRVCDPDGIVGEATFVPTGECEQRLAGNAPWVREPLAAWLTQRWSPDDAREFHYEVHGTARNSLRVERQR